MKRFIIMWLVMPGLFLFEANRCYAEISTGVEQKFTEELRIINNDSRLNPDNGIQHLAEGAALSETHLTLSDYFNDRKTARWLFKSYSFYSSETNEEGKRLNFTRIDELFADKKNDKWFFSVGKRRINLGTAMAFNPVNIIVPPRDPLNPKQETEGQPVAWFSFNQSSVTTDLFFTRNYDKDWKSDLNRWGVRMGIVSGEWDLSGYYFDGEAYKSYNNRDYERMLGLSLSTNLADGVTLYSEMAGFNHNYRKYYDSNGTGEIDDERYVKGVVGSYIVLGPESFLSFFNGDANLTLEAYYNGSGYARQERKNYFEALDQALPIGNLSVLEDYRFPDMSRLYFLADYRDIFKERYTIGLSGLVSQDKSFSLQGQVQYDLSDYYVLKSKLTRNYGGRQTEFGNVPVSGLIEISFDVNF